MGVTRVNTAHGVRWRARTTFNGKRHSLGQYERRYQAEDAIKAFHAKNGMEYESTLTPEQRAEDEMDKHLDNIDGVPNNIAWHENVAASIKPRQMGAMARLKAWLKR